METPTASPGADPGESAAPAPSHLPRPQLDAILAAHAEWVESAGRAGACADLSDQDLGEADLRQANLRNALLVRANLQRADLTGADLDTATMEECDLQGALLVGTTLRDADLADADLTGVRGLVGGQLGGANLSGAHLPDAIGKFEGLALVLDAAKSGGALFVSMLLACAYASLTIGSTTDARLLANSMTSQLPVVNTPLPIVQFYALAPLLILGVYLAYLFQMQRLWEWLADLPAIFQDGRTLDKRVNSMLVSGLVHANFAQLTGTRPPLSWAQEKLVTFAAWWLVPLTLLLFWGRYLHRHEWVGTIFHIVIFVAAVAFGTLLHHLAIATLRGNRSELARWKSPLGSPTTYRYGAGALLIGGVLTLLSYGGITGVPEDRQATAVPRLDPSDLRIVVPRLFAFFNFVPFADLQGAEVSVKPDGWTDQNKNDVHLVRGAHLNDSQMRYARASGAFLVNAQMEGARLHGARLIGADMRRVDLQGADVSYTLMKRVRLYEGELMAANLSGADLSEADLQGADLTGARLPGANLAHADLHGARLQRADLTGAYLDQTNLAGADLRSVRGLTQNQLDMAVVDVHTLVSPPLDIDASSDEAPLPQRQRQPPVRGRRESIRR